MHDAFERLCWYALKTRSRHEKVVRNQLAAKEIDQLLPLWQRRSVWKDRVKMIDAPLFSGYLFVHIALRDKLQVLQTVGAVALVGISGQPVAVPDDQIQAIRTMVKRQLRYDSHPFLREGMRVRVIRGALAGTEGILVHKKRHYRLVISVALIQQSVAVEIDSADVEPLG